MITKIKTLVTCVVLLQLQACDNSNKEESCLNVVPTLTSESKLFDGVNQNISLSEDSGNRLAIACHNCYDNSRLEYQDTLVKIEAAMEEGVDLIELDIIQENKLDAKAVISHGGNLNGLSYEGGSFEKVVESEILTNASQILFIEIKDKIESKAHIRSILNILKKQRNSSGDSAYFRAERFTIIRSSRHYETLSNFRDVLSEDEFVDIQPYLKLSRLYLNQSHNSMTSDVYQAYQCGLDMVEFDIKTNTDTISLLSDYAKALGIAVNVFTLNEENYKPSINELKHNVDIVTVSTEVNNKKFENEISIYARVKKLIEYGEG
ncbi:MULTISPECIES: hypothetical protein [unclassified Pseudoalteromonas]|uniref:hypothetical protein n=1 Tax=unclassified Pseudoalteromonas TaxID=194690 RepID=UPI0005A76EB7|nr:MULTISPECIES: hypothetical protein [unclassified Pseudoalteromonas]